MPMLLRNNPALDYDLLEREIQGILDASDALEAKPGTSSSPEAARTAKELMTIEALYALEDEAFIRQAYRCFLDREPDEQGFNHYLNLLREGHSKGAVAASLRYSPAGRARSQTIDLPLEWLKWAPTKIPVVGKLYAALGALLGIAKLKRTTIQNQRELKALRKRIDDFDHLYADLNDMEYELNRQRLITESQLREDLSALEYRLDGQLRTLKAEPKPR